MKHERSRTATFAAAFALAALGCGGQGAQETTEEVSAATSTPLSWNEYSHAIMSFNDLQSTPTNTVYNTVYDPNNCVWNDEDEWTDVGRGTLAGGQSTSDTICLVADYCTDGACPHVVLFQVSYDSKLSLTLTNNVGDVWTTPTIVGSGNRKTYEFCVQDTVAMAKWGQGPTAWPTVPNTNGGVGQIVQYTLTATNKGNGSLQFSGGFEIGPDQWGGPILRTLSSVSCPPWPG